MNCINILLLILIIFVILTLISIDHFRPINSLKIKYNANNVIVPDKLVNKTKKPTLSIKEKIIAELKSSPLSFENQLYSMDVYPHVGEKQTCLNDNDCSTLTSRCNKDVFDRNSGIGMCTVKTPDKTVFDIEY